MNFENPFFIISIVTGGIFFLGGLITLKYPSRDVNEWYGYRTPRSMKNKEAWDFAQKYSSKKMIKYGVILILISLLGIFNFFSPRQGIFIGLGLIIAFSILIILRVESEIKKRNL